RRRAPRRDLVARRGPDLAAVQGAVRREERVLAQVALQDDQVFVEDRRAAEAPLVLGEDDEAGVQGAQVALPQELAVVSYQGSAIPSPPLGVIRAYPNNPRAR